VQANSLNLSLNNQQQLNSLTSYSSDRNKQTEAPAEYNFDSDASVIMPMYLKDNYSGR